MGRRDVDERADQLAEGADQPAEPAADHHNQRPHRKRNVVLVVTTLLVVAIIAIVAVPLLLREGADPVSLTDASRRFRLAHPGVPEGALPLVPPEGVYEYRGHGTDKLSILPFAQEHGPVMPGTIAHAANGCWTFRIDYSDKHWQRWRYCPSGEELDEAGGQTRQSWDLGVTTIANLSTAKCRSPILQTDMKVGDTWPQRCELVNDRIAGETVSAGTMRYLGIDDVEVDGTVVPAYHVRQQREITGGQHGTESSDLWFAPTGLPVRARQTISVASPSPVGDVTYDQDGEFRLQSLTPQR